MTFSGASPYKVKAGSDNPIGDLFKMKQYYAKRVPS